MRAPENIKKSRPKKHVKSNKSISRIFFDQIPFFAISKMAKNHFLNWGKSLKLPRMQFHEKKLFIYLILRVFCLDFFKFSGSPCPIGLLI